MLINHKLTGSESPHNAVNDLYNPEWGETSPALCWLIQLATFAVSNAASPNDEIGQKEGKKNRSGAVGKQSTKYLTPGGGGS